ncbi:methyltransferase GidB [Hyphomonas neptunium ATCC 15444]|uniref:Ribosomal RNA small subunit methyltransferase G n=2 Tax=Hyphomonas TaxID=85 RepID=RSMG_HYPNA|nr:MULTISPECIES: 16S rRNA (guanine(527)-N(7))-methyltransferase RsmG [Hyphomonas]Q0BWB0.1 RecName: Full=Ribosomal RNA small subunit methyltransferase G; AltName: Full=16S rRNA 7-methylguanosine methyltransferase; Short=16S rRNA m7G methyltransferase [Hyphomonas neptunium ATCC 15444]ABI77044.1 methyltransferase GidB [Hyphomonas neptunium ATCC 15444]KCZ94808.1 methyltransferase GidB [Hyphomonas hirschiana VP5]
MSERDDRAAFLAANDVSRETLDRLDRVIDTLDVWRQKSNLIGPKEWPQIWTRHVGDSWQLLDHIPETAHLVDLGSGAGFPGLIIAAARSLGHVTMIESVGKKCAFLRAAIQEADLSAAVHQGRVEAAPPIKAEFVTARAFAPLPELLDYAAPWLRKGAVGVFPKGERWNEELTAARQRWNFAYEAIPSRSGGSGVILIIREVARRND